MPWYGTGTVAVTANSATVTGTGTAFSANARVGDAFRGPDGRWYEITNIASATVLSIRPNYQGTTASGQAYTIAPMQGYVKESADRLRQLVDQFGAQLAALQPWAYASTATEARGLVGAAPVASPTFTGDPRAPTPAATDNDTSIATTAHVKAAISLATQSSPTDTTAGALMAVGAFGLGSRAVTSGIDFNELPTLYPYTGFVPVLTNNLSANAPGSNSCFYVQQMFWSGGTNVCQIAYPYRMDNDGFWMRTLFNGSWSQWRRMSHTGNILGTVSHSGGVPTGAIIERGSNANGEYTRYADGTQICWGARTLNAVPAGGSTSVSITFPAAFSASPAGAGASPATAEPHRFIASISPSGATSAVLACGDLGAGLAAISARWFVIGRWY